MTIAVLGTLDSKGHEHQFVANIIAELNHTPLLIDVGSYGPPLVTPDITRYAVAEASGVDLQPIIESQDRGRCIRVLSEAAAALLSKLVKKNAIQGVISLGGGGGTSIGTAAMRALPIGFPKLMVSTLASGNTAHYIGNKDITMMPSIVDVAGLNSISKTIFTRAAYAICGMASAEVSSLATKPIIVASMFGNTTQCVNYAKSYLESAGYEVLIFHATGTGGRTMEEFIESGMVAGILDLTTTEWADELLGGSLSAGPTRMDAMSTANVPAVIAPGCLDMANFGSMDTLPEKFANRITYAHNPQATLVRTNVDECKKLGEIIAQKANANPAPTAILNPLKAISMLSEEGEPFHNPQANQALFDAIRRSADVAVVNIDATINSQRFAEAAANKLLELIEQNQS